MTQSRQRISGAKGLSTELEILRAARDVARAYRLQYAQALLEGDPARNLALIASAQEAIEALDRALDVRITAVAAETRQRSAPVEVDEDLGALFRDLQDVTPYTRPTRAA